MKSRHTILSLIIIFAMTLGAKSEVNLDNWQYKNSFLTDTFPADLPIPIIDIDNNPSPGFYFFGTIPNKPAGNELANYLIVADSSGTPFKYKKAGNNLAIIPLNFMQSKSGLFNYIEKTPTLSTIYVTDTDFNLIDSIPNKNTSIIQGYYELLPNGNFLVDHISDRIPMDFSTIFEGGEPNGTLQSSTILEYDRNKNLVFMWRAHDYIPITDTYTDTLGANVPYVHINNVIQDTDGNYLVSSRHLSTIFKINRVTGDIIWKLGGKHNEFTFINEHEENAPTYFSFQHDIRRLPNGNISIFDNGTQHSPKYSRAAEYQLDEVNKTATLVWEYRHSPDIYANAQGSAQRLPNGNVVISWGDAAAAGEPAITEVKPDNSIALEMTFPDGLKSLRAGKYPLIISKPSAEHFEEILEGNTYEFASAGNNTCTKIKIVDLVESFYPIVRVKKYDFSPVYPEFNEPIAPMVHDKRIVISLSGIVKLVSDVRFNASCLGIVNSPELYQVYQRDKAGSGVFKLIPTLYDAKTDELTISTSTYGEFMFALPQAITKPYSPWLTSPKDGGIELNSSSVKFSWSPRGFLTASRIQVSTDSAFTDILVDSTLSDASSLNLSGLGVNSSFYWRVSTNNVSLFSDWSETRKFYTAEPFLALVTPNGGETFTKDGKKNIIRWNNNITDLLKVELLRDNTSILLIKDSLNSPTSAYGWIIPQDIENEDNYQIRVTSISNSQLSTISSDYFSIDSIATGIEENTYSNEMSLEVFPNPIQGSSRFELTLSNANKVVIQLFDILGNKAATVFDGYMSAGSNSIDWDSRNLSAGKYFWQASTSNETITGSITLVR